MKQILSVLAVLAVATSGCAALGQSEAHFQVKATSSQGDSDDFSAILVQVGKILVHREGQPGADAPEGNETGDGWVQHSVAFNKQTVDLLKTMDGDTWEFFNKTIEPGSYSQLRLEVKSARGTLLNGTKIEIEAPSTIKFSSAFTADKGKTTTFVADLVVRESGGAYRLESTSEGTKVMGPA